MARGKYKKGAGSVSLLMAISGDERVGEAFSFHRCFTEGGTNLWRFFNYMQDLMDWLDINRPGRSFLFTMDNLNLHRHPVTTNLIYARGHRIVFRAPYWSCDGAIEYVSGGGGMWHGGGSGGGHCRPRIMIPHKPRVPMPRRQSSRRRSSDASSPHRAAGCSRISGCRRIHRGHRRRGCGGS